RSRLREPAYDRAVDAGAVVRVCVARAAIARRGDMTRRPRYHFHAGVGLAVVAARAALRDSRRRVIEGRQREADESRAMAHEAILSRRRQWHGAKRLHGPHE